MKGAQSGWRNISMVSFDLDIDTAKVRESVRELKDDWEGNATFVVGTNVKYAVFP